MNIEDFATALDALIDSTDESVSYQELIGVIEIAKQRLGLEYLSAAMEQELGDDGYEIDDEDFDDYDEDAGDEGGDQTH
ncbi:MAG: hypothetical protein AAF515_14085 [Pseudomonadota bacterium]